MYWVPDPAPPAALTSGATESARIVTRTGTVIVVDRPRLTGDTIVGAVIRGNLRDTVRVAVADVRSLSVEKVHAGRTGGMVIGLSVALLVAVVAFSNFGGAYPTY